MVSFQTTTQAQDELAALFSRNLTFNPELQSRYQTQKPKIEEVLRQDSAPTDSVQASAATAPIIYSITQHYTHTAHIVRRTEQLQEEQQQQQQEPQQQIQRPSSEPPQTDQLTPEIVLSQHGIDPSVLAPAQIQLFRLSEERQQLRLIEIWRAAPPTSSNDNPSLAWTSTTLEQEEQLARMRYERMEVERQQQQQTMSLDGTQVQADDGRWLAPSIAHNVEPYMMSGYEEMMRREYEREREREQADRCPASSSYSHNGTAVGSGYKLATDPVYKGFGDDWAREQQSYMQIQMENQYGAFQQFGGPTGNMEAMEIL